MTWWREGVLYQIYPRSFSDSNGDGIGDLAGVTAKLDYLDWLGIDGIWLNPTFPSPNVDWGYDVADYLGVHADLGTLDDLDRLVAEARRRGIHVLLDLVPNHTSNQHPWFRQRPELYLWSDEIPNNWQAAFGGPAWTWDEERHAYYMHNFAVEQPDLDWWNAQVRDEFDRILRFWFDRGIAGFRIDVANSLVKDRELRDNPPASDTGDPWARRRGFVPLYNANRPEVHDVYRRWRALADEYEPPRVLVGEAWVWDFAQWAAFWGSGSDELHMAFAFQLLDAPFEAETLRNVVAETEAALPPGAWPALAGSNHDVTRMATRWCGGDDALVRCALLILLSLRGTPFLYYGDELGLEDGAVAPGRVRDVADPPRDPARTPMPWTPGDGGWREPWLPLADTSRNVEEQRADPRSILHFTRELISLRRGFAWADYEALEAPAGVWAWRRGDFAIAVNLGEAEAPLAVAGQPLLTTEGEYEGLLRPRQGVVLAVG
jgi:alpha-glucosidase